MEEEVKVTFEFTYWAFNPYWSNRFFGSNVQVLLETHDDLID